MSTRVKFIMVELMLLADYLGGTWHSGDRWE